MPTPALPVAHPLSPGHSLPASRLACLSTHGPPFKREAKSLHTPSLERPLRPSVQPAPCPPTVRVDQSPGRGLTFPPDHGFQHLVFLLLPKMRKGSRVSHRKKDTYSLSPFQPESLPQVEGGCAGIACCEGRAGLARSGPLLQGPPPSPATSPLPVLIQAVDDGVALLNEGHELPHQHLLSAPVLLCPVLFCPRRKVGELSGGKPSCLPRKPGTNA